MNIKIYNWVVITLSFLVIPFMSCHDEKCGDVSGTNYKYDLVVNVSISPAQELYRVGDTITMEAVFPRMAFNRAKDDFETVRSQELNHFSWLDELENFDGIPDASEHMKILTSQISGHVDLLQVSGGSRVTGSYSDVNGEDYRLGYQFVLTTPGYFRYFFAQLNGFDTLAGEYEIEDPCPNGKFQLFHEVNGGADNNFNLLCESNEVFCSNAWGESRRENNFDRHAGYVFRVVE